MNGEPENPPVQYDLVQCGRCNQISLEIREDYGNGFSDDEPVTVYPAPQRLSWTIPDPLRSEWEEARRCFKAKAYAACMVMVRRTVEGTCADQGVVGRTLAESLNALQRDGSIDGTLAAWADALRIAGNRGAHYTGELVSREDAEDALSFSEALLDHLYVLRKRFSDFQARLETKKTREIVARAAVPETGSSPSRAAPSP